MRHRIAIIGGGFSGTVLAAHLLRETPRVDTDIVLIERGPAVGRGVAYARRGWPYLLNVPAGRLSADARSPLQFLHFAQRFNPHANAEDFLTRELYGVYLEEVLQQAERGSSAKISFTRAMAEVVGIAERAGSSAMELQMAEGPSVVADRVVLALGNPPPGEMFWSRSVCNHPAYRAHPWSCPGDLGPEKTVLIIGTGLTMVDAAISLTADLELAPRVIAISRHGLTPLPQSQFHAGAQDTRVDSALATASSARELFATVRELSAAAVARDADWREVITSVRHLAPGIWQRLPPAERRRFLRHLRAYWDVHRHRIPGELAARLELSRRAGKVSVSAGRIVAIEPKESRLEVQWRERQTQRIRSLQADLVLNATGPETSISRSSDPLLSSLHKAGLIVEDELSLGLLTGPHGACVKADGAVSGELYYLGPMLRATHWESTAATELRDHAARLSSRLMATY